MGVLRRCRLLVSKVPPPRVEGAASSGRRCRLLGSKVPPPRVEGAASLHLTSTSEDFYMRTPVRTYLIKNHENVWRIPQKPLSLHVMRQKTFQTRYISYVLLALTCLLTACSGGGSSSEELDPPAPNPTPSPTPENQEIKLNASVWNMMEGMRATFYDAGTITSGSFKASAYVANTITAYINPVQVNWDTDKWVWSDGKHYWPAEGALDFFAYMPSNVANSPYSPGYNLVNDTPSPTVTCTSLPLSHYLQKDLKEFIYAWTKNQSKADPGAAGVTLNFLHPFARVKIVWSGGSAPAGVTIHSINFNKIYVSGRYVAVNNEWEYYGSNDHNLEFLDQEGLQVNEYLLVMPQNWGGSISVNATWTDWGEDVEHHLTTSVPTNWQPGYSYTYTLTITKTDLKVDLTKFTEQW